MTGDDASMIKALADADRQYEHVKKTLTDLSVRRARELLATEPSETEAWALLGLEMIRGMQLEGENQRFAAELLAAAAIQIAKNSRP